MPSEETENVAGDHGAKTSKFSVLRTYVVLSVIACSTILIVVGLGLDSVVCSSLMVDAEGDAEDLATAMRDTQLGLLFRTDEAGRAWLQCDENQIPEIDRRISRFLAPFDVVKIKVYDLERRLIYCSDHSLIGKDDTDNPDLARALGGQTVSKMARKDSILDLEGEERLTVDVVETYVPIFDNGRIIGATEIYSDIGGHLARGISMLRQGMLILTISVIAVFTLLGLPVVYASKTIRTRTNELMDSRRELKEALKRSRTADCAKSRFLAQMSHEIRTPMTAIMGYADLIADDQHSPEELGEYVATIRRNGEHLLAIINDILDISKIEAGKMTVEVLECSPTDVINEVVSLLRIPAQSKGVALETDFISPIPTTIRTDPVRFKQILVNLVGNAVKFTNEGRITVRMRVHYVDIDSPLFQIDIVDTGIGIALEQLDSIFKPFTQADSATTRRFGGTGLGLTICHRLVDLLGGRISAKSELGGGSTFSVFLPASNVDIQSLEDLQESDLNQTPDEGIAELTLCGRILLVEDGVDNQRLLCHHLRRAGAEVEVANNGQIAVDMILAESGKGRNFDLVLMDMQMPEMDGYTATYTLRQHRFDVPILALTAHAMAGDRQKCIDAGCDDYLTKPINRATLIKTCARWIVRHKAKFAA